jgi:predicted membrane channel-forming protein YqfA (hemolysin III family)
MPEKSLLESCRAFGIKEWAHVVFMVLIMCAGGYLIVYSVYMMTLNNDATMFMFAIAMFGVGCTTIWFALSHVEIQSTEEKLENITTRLDNIIKKIEKQ